MKVIDSNLPPPVDNPSWLRRLLNRFCFYETMSGNGACPVYLERWTLLQALGCALYLHHFIGDDWAVDPHDHPRRFISIGLKGWYYEDVFNEDGTRHETLRFQAPWARSFPAEHLHRVRASECGDCWTLVIVLRKCRSWGFVRDGVWVPFKRYVFGSLSRKSCAQKARAETTHRGPRETSKPPVLLRPPLRPRREASDVRQHRSPRRADSRAAHPPSPRQTPPPGIERAPPEQPTLF